MDKDRKGRARNQLAIGLGHGPGTEAWAMGQGLMRGLGARAVGQGCRVPFNDALSGQNPCKKTIRHKKIIKWDST